jgi:putative transposase
MILLSQEGILRMLSVLRLLHHAVQLVCTLLPLLGNTARFLLLCQRPLVALAAENLFLRKQLALHREWNVKPWRVTDTARLSMVWLARWFDWRQALAVVEP